MEHPVIENITGVPAYVEASPAPKKDLEYQEQGVFYPLKLPFVPHKAPSPPENISRNISFATKEGIPSTADMTSERHFWIFSWTGGYHHCGPSGEYRRPLCHQSGMPGHQPYCRPWNHAGHRGKRHNLPQNGNQADAGGILLPRLFGVTGVWLAVPVAEGLMFFVSVSCLFYYRDRYAYWPAFRNQKLYCWFKVSLSVSVWPPPLWLQRRN